MAICSRADGRDVNAWLVENGHALDWLLYSKGRYKAQQAAAEAARRGMWRGSFIEPWEAAEDAPLTPEPDPWPASTRTAILAGFAIGWPSALASSTSFGDLSGPVDPHSSMGIGLPFSVGQRPADINGHILDDIEVLRADPDQRLYTSVPEIRPRAVKRCTVERLMADLGLQGVVRGKIVRSTVPDKAAPCPLDPVNRVF